MKILAIIILGGLATFFIYLIFFASGNKKEDSSESYVKPTPVDITDFQQKEQLPSPIKEDLPAEEEITPSSKPKPKRKYNRKKNNKGE